MWGNILKEMVRRLRMKNTKNKAAKKFQERCKKAGVREHVLYKSEILIGSGASPTTASPVARALLWQEMRQAVRTMPGGNVRWIDSMYIADKLGPQALKKVLPSNPKQTDAAIINEATGENDRIARGIPVLVDMMQDHVIHIQEHLTPIEGIADAAIKGQPTKQEQLITVQFISQHIEEHLGILVTDETRVDQFKELNKRYNTVKQTLVQIINTAISQSAGEGKETDPA